MDGWFIYSPIKSLKTYSVKMSNSKCTVQYKMYNKKPPYFKSD